MGGMIGAAFGTFGGSILAFQYRQFGLIPLMAISSGGSFGFFMGIGQVIRSGEMAPRVESEDETYTVLMLRPDGKFVRRAPYEQM